MSKEKTDAAAVLFPEISVEHGDEKIIVKEFTFGQGLRTGPLIAPIVADMKEIFVDDSDEIPLQGLSDVFADHEESFFKLMSMVTGLSPEKINSLPDRTGHQLLLAFWAVNASFFVNRVVESMMQDQEEEPISAAS